MLAADIEAHKCPKCGKAEWRIYRGGGAPTNVTPIRPEKKTDWFLVILTVGVVCSVVMVALVAWREWRAVRA
jgi:hypothetical protein